MVLEHVGLWRRMMGPERGHENSMVVIPAAKYGGRWAYWH